MHLVFTFDLYYDTLIRILFSALNIHKILYIHISGYLLCVAIVLVLLFQESFLRKEVYSVAREGDYNGEYLMCGQNYIWLES